MDRRDWLKGMGTMLAAPGLLASTPSSARLRPGTTDAGVFPLSGPVQPQQLALGADGDIWFAGLRGGIAGRLSPSTGLIGIVPLGPQSKPRGIVSGPDGRLYVLDQGQGIVHAIDPVSQDVQRFTLPHAAQLELTSGVFGTDGRLWFTGQAGWFGWLHPATGKTELIAAPGERGPFSSAIAPDGQFWFTSYAANLVVRVDPTTANVLAIPLPPQANGPKGLAIDTAGNLWLTAVTSGTVSRYVPQADQWSTWTPRGPKPRPYAVTTDEAGMIWISDTGADRILRFDPRRERFDVVQANLPRSMVRHILRVGDWLWLAESGTDRIVTFPIVSKPA